MNHSICFEYLLDRDICQDALDTFNHVFEKELEEEGSVEVSEKNCIKYAEKFDWECASRKLLSFKQRDLFNSLIKKSKHTYTETENEEFDIYSAIERPAFEKFIKPINEQWDKFWNHDNTLWNKVLSGVITWEEFNAIVKNDEDIIKKNEAEAKEKYNAIKGPAHDVYLKKITIAGAIKDGVLAKSFAISFNSSY